MKQHVQKLLFGNGLAQVIQFSSLLLLSRLYQPTDFGLLAQVQSAAMLMSIFSTLQLHLVIPLQKTSLEANNSVYSIQAITLFVSTFFIIFSVFINEIYFFAAILSLFLGLANIYSGIIIFSGNFGLIARFYVVRSITIVFIQILFSLISIENGLILASLFAEALSAIYLQYTRFGWRILVRFNFRTMFYFAKTWRAFSLYGTIQEAVSVTAFYVPLFLFAHKFGQDVGGQYAMASRIIWAPIILISTSISQVLYHSYGKSNPRSISELYASIPYHFAILIISLSIIIALTGQNIILLMLGKNWLLAAEMIPIALVWGSVFILSVPFRVYLRTNSLQKFHLMIDTGMIFAFLFLFYFFDRGPAATLWALTTVALMQNLSLVLISTWKLRKTNFER